MKRFSMVSVLLLVTVFFLSSCATPKTNDDPDSITSDILRSSETAIIVSADITDGWDIKFDDTTAKLYDPQGVETGDPIAVIFCESEKDYSSKLEAAKSLADYTET